jgi:hypothetical protein
MVIACEVLRELYDADIGVSPVLPRGTELQKWNNPSSRTY